MEDIILKMIFDQNTPNHKRKVVGKGKNKETVVVDTMKYKFIGKHEGIDFILSANGELREIKELFAPMKLDIHNDDEIVVSLSKSE